MDAVIALPNGKWCGFEIKTGANQIDVAAENLIKNKKAIESMAEWVPIHYVLYVDYLTQHIKGLMVYLLFPLQH